MKNILLLGDSIKQNYQENVEKALSGIANVYYTRDNGRFGLFMLRYLHEWVNAMSNHGQIQFDIIHFNCGLWDVLKLSNENNLFTSKDGYRSVLERIVNRLRYLCPSAEIIFALTTEVIEPGFEPGTTLGERRNSDIAAYNDIAIELFNNHKIEIDDLWTVSREMPKECRSDLVHFDTELGKKMLAESVVNCLMKYCM